MAKRGRPKKFDEPLIRRTFELPESMSIRLDEEARRSEKHPNGLDVVEIVRDALTHKFTLGEIQPINPAVSSPVDVLNELSEIRARLENFTVIGKAEPVHAIEDSTSRLLLMEVSCGPGLEMHEMTEVMGEARSFRFEGKLARIATPNSFVARAKGLSMQCEFPESVSPGDLLLMTPYAEFIEQGNAVTAGTIMLAKLHFYDAPTRYTLKEYTGKKLKANNAEYQDIDFGPELKRAEIYAVCRGVLERIFN